MVEQGESMSKNERNIAVDIIKAFAIFGVVVIHVVSPILTGAGIGSFEWFGGLFWGALFRASVPLFFMCSGAIMMNPQKPLTLRKLYFHNILRIVAAMLFWGTAYKIYHLWEWNQLWWSNIYDALKHVLVFDQEFHFYYLHIILIFYILLPLSRFFVEKADKRLIEYGLLFWLIFAVIYPTALNFYPFTLFGGITPQWAVNLTYASLGYGVLGYYLMKYPLSAKKAVILSVAGFAVVFGMTFYMSRLNGTFNDIFTEGASIGVLAMAAGFFSLASRIKTGEAGGKIAVYVSKASFSVYLTHLFVIYLYERFAPGFDIMPSVLSIPLFSAAVMSICVIIYALLSKIPIINRWII